MALQQTTSQRPKLSFRRLVRASVSAQTIVVLAVLAVTLWGALATVRTSNDLRDRSQDALFLRGLQTEFSRSRTALREYVNTEDVYRLGSFSQAQAQITRISSAVGEDVSPDTSRRLRVYLAGITAYLNDVGDRCVRLVRSGRKEDAIELLNSRETLKSVKAIESEGNLLYKRFDAAQVAAEHAVRNRQYLNVGLIVLAGLLVLSAGMGVMMWIRREMMLPLDDLATASRKLGHGDLSARVTPRGVEEITLASSAFNQMADEIEQQVLQLHEASAARSRFVSSVSHELRTPITSLRGYLELLAGGEAGELAPDQQHYVNIAERNARALDELINDLLTLSRIQSGRISLNPEPVDIRLLLRELKAEMMPIATEKKVDLVLVDTGELVVSGDPLRLKQAFGNLVGNAIKYSPKGQAVVLRAFRINRQVVVSVVDWGMGIPKDDLPQLAEPFFRSSSNDRIPGTGLGLPIAKQMIELHGGRLAVESEPGAGSTFTVYLPLRSEPGELLAAQPKDAPRSNIDSSAEGDIVNGDDQNEKRPDDDGKPGRRDRGDSTPAKSDRRAKSRGGRRGDDDSAPLTQL